MKSLRIKTNIAVSETGFVFVPNTGDSFSVNPIGARIMGLIKEGKNDKEIKKALLNEFEADEATLEKDFYDFISQLKQYNLIDEN